MVTSVGRRSGRAPSLGKPRQRPVRIGGQQTIARPLLHRRAPRRRIANLPTRVPARVTHNQPPPISAPRLRDTAHPHCPRRHGARRFQDARQPILQCRSSRQVRNPSEPPTHAAQHSLPPRKTGITLKDTGIRDEHGLEPIDGIFSSPEKSPEKRNNPRQQPDKTLTSSDMDVQQSMFRRANIRVPLHDDSIVDALLASDDEDTKTAPPPAGSMPEPVDALSARRSSVRPGRSSIFPPPMGRSPIKTTLGSSPRRQSSMGPLSALRRPSNTPDRSVFHPAVARRLDFSAMDEKSTRVNGSGNRNRGKPRPDVFALPVSPEPARGKKRSHDESIIEHEATPEESEFQVNGVGHDSPLPVAGDESLQMIADGDETEVDEEHVEDSTEIPEQEPEPEPEPSPEPQPHKNRGRGRKSLEHKKAPAPAPRKGAGRPKKNQGLVSAKLVNAPVPARSRKSAQTRPTANAYITDESTMDVDQSFDQNSIEEPSIEQMVEDYSEAKLEDTLEDEPEQDPTPEPEPVPVKKKRGRKKSASKLEIHQDEPQDPVELPERPAKKAKKAPAPKKPPPSQRDPNARVTSKTDNSKSKQKGKQKEDMPPPPPAPKESQRSQFRAPSQARSLQILRQGTPFDDAGARTTRSGRISAKPVEYWRNERIEYAHDGSKKEIIRAEDVEGPKRSARRTTTRKRAAQRSGSVIEEEEEFELEPEEWEINEGIVQGWVNGWDEKQGTIIDEGARNEGMIQKCLRLQCSFNGCL